MKRLLLLFACLPVYCGLHAQTATFAVQDSIISYANGPIELHAVVTNLTAAPLAIEWKKISATMNTQQFLSICDNHNCYTSTQALMSSFNTSSGPIGSTGNADWYGAFDGSTVSSGGSVYYTINLKDANSSYGKNVTYVLRRFATGVGNTNVHEQGISFYPNPAHGFINIMLDESAGIRMIAIYNLIGKPVGSFKINGSNAQLDIDDLPAGIYMLRFVNGQGVVVATRRFTRQ